jgi:hypothetical protein
LQLELAASCTVDDNSASARDRPTILILEIRLEFSSGVGDWKVATVSSHFLQAASIFDLKKSGEISFSKKSDAPAS